MTFDRVAVVEDALDALLADLAPATPRSRPRTRSVPGRA